MLFTPTYNKMEKWKLQALARARALRGRNDINDPQEETQAYINRTIEMIAQSTSWKDAKVCEGRLQRSTFLLKREEYTI